MPLHYRKKKTKKKLVEAREEQINVARGANGECGRGRRLEVNVEQHAQAHTPVAGLPCATRAPARKVQVDAHFLGKHASANIA